MHKSAIILYLSILCIIIFLWPRTSLRIFKWILIILLICFILLIILWIVIGNNFFLWPVNFQTAPGFERSINNKDGLTVMDSSNQSSKLIVLLPGTCAPLPVKDRKHHTSQWAHRMLHLIRQGFRVFLVQHRFGWFRNNLKQRVQDLQEIMMWIQKHLSLPTLILGDGYGATVVLKWASLSYNERIFPCLQSIVCTEARVTFYSGIKRWLLPSWLWKKDTDFQNYVSSTHDRSPHDQSFTDENSRREGILNPSSQSDNVNNRYNNSDYLLDLLEKVLLKIPIVFVYAKDDPYSDARLWELFLSKHQNLFTEYGRPALFGIRVKSRTLHAYSELPIMDRREWTPILGELFED
jgi:hypothetical protein